MPKKRQSQPIQVWLANVDLLRLQQAAMKTGRSQSDIAREGILNVLKNIEKEEQKKAALNKLFERFSHESEKIVSLATNEAAVTSAPLIGSEHLLLALAASDRPAGKVLLNVGVSHSLVRRHIYSGWPSIYAEVPMPPYSPTLVRIFERARSIAKRSFDRVVQPEHLLLSLLEQGNGFAFNIIELIGFSRDEVRQSLKKEMSSLRNNRVWKRKR